MAQEFTLIFFLVSLLFISVVGETSRIFTIENKCEFTVWPGIISSRELSTTGFVLKKGEARVFNVPFPGAHFWGRSLCSANSTGNFSCATGDCGSGKIECSGARPKPPVTVAELSYGDDGDYYDVSLVEGYNLPLAVVPQHPQSGQKCRTIGCAVNLNKVCPSELKVVGSSGEEQAIGCMSQCQKYNTDQFCCRGNYSTPITCPPTLHSQNLKKECPTAYSYGYDASGITARCSNSSNYVITFCPLLTPNSTNSSSATESPAQAPTNNRTFQPPYEATRTKKKSSNKSKLILGVSAAFIVTIIIVVAVIVTTKNMRKDDWNDKNVEAVVMLKRYSYGRVKKMTNSFAILGKGGFGTVYKGKLPDSGQDVAVKILKETEGNGEEFINEVASMSRTSHVNIVSLLGFCYERNKRAIIYEFMPNGSLDKFISKNMSKRMDWERLYDIAVGVSRGLEYLHNRCVSRIVHFDIKPQNILMDEKLCPKISDFGLAKLCKNKEESIISMLDPRGTVGYIAPEVFSKNFGGASHKSDVYSYGMVVLEMIGARDLEKVKNAQSNNSSVYFPDWIYKDFEQGEIMRMFGDQLSEEEERIAKKLVLVGLWCIQMNPSERPPMIKVIEMLEGSLEALEVPPKPLLFVPAATVPETLEDSNETSSFSNPSQFERSSLPGSEDTLQYSKEVVEESQHRSRSTGE